MFDVKVDYKPATLSAELETRKKKKLSEMNPGEPFNALPFNHNQVFD